MRSIAAPLALAALALLAGAAPASAAPAGGSPRGLERLVAPPGSCRGQYAVDARTGPQERTMLCMTNYARRRAGLRPLRPSGPLFLSASLKSRDVLRCDRFDHSACGRDFTFWMRRVGYIDGPCWRAAENLAYGSGPYATVRSIFRDWIHSSGHRGNILGPTRDIGIGLRVGTLEGNLGAHVWTQHLGSRC